MWHEFVFAHNPTNAPPSKVLLVGSFNQWDLASAIPMVRLSKHLFSVSVNLPAGIHMFKFIVDGQWFYDDHQDTVVDSSGYTNNVVTIDVGDDKNEKRRTTATNFSHNNNAHHSGAANETGNRNDSKNSSIAKKIPGVVKDDYFLPDIDPKWDAALLTAYKTLKTFAESGEKQYQSPTNSTPKERAMLHEMAELFSFHHQPIGKALATRAVLITRKPVDEFKARDQPSLSIPPPDPTFDSEEQEIYDILRTFVLSDREEYRFKTGSKSYRKKVHMLAPAFELEHESVGMVDSRFVIVRKADSVVVLKRKALVDNFEKAFAAYRLNRHRYANEDDAAISVPVTKVRSQDSDDDDDNNKADLKKASTPTTSIPQGPVPPKTPIRKEGVVRYVNWNIEWMDYFFKSDTEFHQSNQKADIEDVSKLCANIACTIRLLAPDIIGIEEGPSSTARMELFQQHFLNNEYNVIANDEIGTQLLYFLVKKDGLLKDAALHVPSDNFLRQEWF